jgi:hypothetical protein
MGRYQYYRLAKVWEGTAPLPPPEEIEDPDTRPEVWLGEGTPHWLHFETLSHLAV